MKRKRKILLTLGLLFSFVTLLGVLAACGKKSEPKQSGSEAGEYYCDYNGAENDLTLGGACEFELKIGTTVMQGEYELEGEILTLSPEGAGEISARYKNERISLTYSDVSYTFLRKIEYTVTFDTDGGTTIAPVKVINGRTVARPATNPEKTDMIFVGWYTDTTYQNPFYFTQPITGNKTLHARFVEALDPEFDVKFDLGYTGATAMAPIRTAGHKLYPDQLTEPTRADGVAFIGWYVSDFETREKLSREFDVEAEVAQDFTLFAVWDENPTGAPVVSVTESGVEISAAGDNLGSYNLKITDPNSGETTHTDALTTGATTKYSYDFASKDEGEYKIEVEVSGKTTTRYLNNKALARVSDFRVELAGDTRTLIFNSVAGATEYKITVECGAEGHDATHTELSLGTKTSYDFSECEMGTDKTIKFTVMACADGHVASVSEKYIYDKALDAVDDVSFDEATGEVTWNKVEYATAYNVTVLLNDQTVVEKDVLQAGDASEAAMRYSVKYIGKGNVTVKVTPAARGWNSPEAATCTFVKETIAAPKNVHLDGEAIKWDKVEGATGYEVFIGTEKKTVPADAGADVLEYHLQAAELGSAAEVEVKVYAVTADGAEKSYASETVTVINTNTIRGLAYEGGYATWEYVFGATQYQYKVGDGDTWSTVTTPKAAIMFNAAGKQTISVKAVKDGTESPVVTIEVDVYTVEFDIGDAANEINEVADKYLAAGDPITLPQPEEWVGYNFDGWYRDGYNGKTKYEETTFEGDAPLTLYAKFIAETYTITLVTGPQGECEEETFTVSYRQSNFTLPVPTPTTVEYTFQGWYRGVNGTGAQFADLSGGNTGTYTLRQDITVYAKWTTPFVYTKVSGGYSVSVNASIGATKEITVPVLHNGEHVVTVQDFTAGTSLEVIHIPNTVTTISLGSIGTAFEDLTKLKEIDIYKVEDNRAPKYASKDGMVYEVDTMALIYVPVAYKGTEVTLPEGIRSIRAGAIYQNTTITKLTIPASVTEVQAEAIYGSNSTSKDKLKTIEFLSATDGGSLTIADKAFVSLASLTTITIPQYTTDFSAAKWDTCTKITDINVTGAKAGDKLFSDKGVLCRTISNETSATQEIVYYPSAKKDTTYKIPDNITSIGDAAFKGETDFTSITIPAQITHIGKEAFYGCTKLATLTFDGTEASPDLTIEQQAFYNCNFTSVELPANLVKTEWQALYSKSSAVLASVIFHGRSASLGGKTPEIAPATFNFKASGTTVTLDANYPAINLASALAMQGSGTLQTATPVASVVETITIDPQNPNYVVPAKGEDGYGGIFNAGKTQLLFVFSKVEKVDLTSFTIPNTVTEISSFVFKGKTGLTSITIPASVTAIADYAFQGCSKLTEVTFTGAGPEAERAALTIGRYAFASCGTNATNSLTTISLPAETTEIGEGAFSGCNKLKSFTVPANVKHIAASTFYNCTALTDVELQEGVLSIGEGAFELSGLTSVTLPASLESVGTQAFYNCAALSEITVSPESKTFASKEGALYEKTLKPGSANEYIETTLMFVAKSATGDEEQALNIPETVTHIATEVMRGNKTIKAVKFADEVKGYTEDGTETLGTLTIGEKAFYQATALETVHFPAGLRETVTDTSNGGGYEGLFYGCNKLTTVNIPYTVTVLSSGTFYNCALLKNVTFDPTPEETEAVPLVFKSGSASSGAWYGVFYGCTALTEITLPERTTTFERDTFWGTSLTRLTLPSTLTGIPSYAVSGEALVGGGGYSMRINSLQNLQEIIFPDHVAENCVIASDAFYMLPSLTKLGYSKQVEIDGEAQENVDFLPEGITEIGKNALYQLPKLKSIGFPSTLETVGTPGDTAIISYCTGIETVVFADNCALEAIDGNYFINQYGKSAVKRVIFGENMKLRQLGGTATSTVSVFGNTPNLTSITIPASVETIGSYAFVNLMNLSQIEFAAESKLTFVGDSAFQRTGITSFTFPEATDETGAIAEIEVGTSLFNGCSSLASVSLSKSIWDITGVFTGCAALETITVDEENEYFEIDAKNKIIFGLGADGKHDAMLYVYGNTTGRIVVPDGTVEIATGAYKGKTSIESLVIPYTVVKIGESAFENCVNLESVDFTVPAGQVSALSFIADNAFNNCRALASFDFAKAVNLNRIGAYAFAHCGFTKLDLSKNTLLDKNAVGSTVKGLGNYAFAYNEKLGTELINGDVASSDYTSIKLPNGISSFGTYVFAYNPALVHVDLRNTSYTSIPNYTFANCTALTDVKLPAGITTIGQHAFEYIGSAAIDLSGYEHLTKVDQYAFRGSAITSVKLPDTLSTLGNFAFTDCASLQEADLSACTALTAIGNQMFNGCSALETVKLPTTVKSTGSSTFKNCVLLAEIVLPEGFTTIGQNCFEGCSALKEIKFPTTLTTITSGSAFLNSGLTTVDLSKTKVTSITTSTFKDCVALTTVTLPAKLTTIDQTAFSGTAISTITLPKTVTKVNKQAFENCISLTSVAVEDETTKFEVGDSAFNGCTNLATFPFAAISKGSSSAKNFFAKTGFTQITLPNINWASGYVFADCTKLTDVTFEAGVTQVYQYTFSGCEALERVTFKAAQGTDETPSALALTTIATHAFSGCSSLGTITFEGALSKFKTLGTYAFEGTDISSIDLSASTLTKIDANVFEGCASLTSIQLPESVTSIGSYAFSGCTSLTQESITMEGVTSIGAYAFSNTGFTSFTITDKITTVGGGAFSDCASLTSVTVDGENNEHFATGENGEIYQLSKTSGTNPQDLKTLIYYPANADTLSFAEDMTDFTDGSIAGYTVKADGSKEFTIPDYIKHIKANAFRGVELDKLIVPDSDNLVGGIANTAFGESLIKEIVFECGKDAFEQTSPSSMFKNSTALTSITFPADLTEIGTSWFDGCTSLKTIEIPSTVTTLALTAFSNSSITNLTIPETVTSIGVGAFSSMPDLTTITINAALTELDGTGSGYMSNAIVDSLFANSTNLANVTLGGKLEVISTNWFMNLPNLKNITIPATVTAMGSHVFDGSGLESITFAPRTEALTLGSYIFQGTKLKTLSIPGTVDSLPQFMATDCTELKWVYLEEGVTMIDSNAFRGCTALEFVNIPSSVTTLDMSAFNGATSVHVFIPSTVGMIKTSTTLSYRWNPTESNHIYFGSSLYEAVVTYGLDWFNGTDLDTQVTFGSNYKAAYDASGLTDEDNFPLKPDAADANGKPKAD